MTTYYLFQDAPAYEKKLLEIKRQAKRDKQSIVIIGTVDRPSFEVEYRGKRDPYIDTSKPVIRQAVQVVAQ